VVVVGDGHTALTWADKEDVDLLVLDLGLPGMDGLDVCRRLRRVRPDLPVLMLTARTDEVDFVVGLDAGADDYVAKPFRLAELLARVRALLRRSVPDTPDALEAGGVRMDLAGRRVLIEGAEIALANKEFELLRVLLSRPGQVVSREEILREVWKDPELKNSKTLDMHMSWLRRKIGSSRIATVRGVGFRFDAL
jgi:DNA-binding response OmpR family regulator